MAEIHSWQYLIDRYLEGACSKEELDELLRRVAEHQDTATLDDVLKEHWARMGEEASQKTDEARWEALYKEMMQGAAQEEEREMTQGVGDVKGTQGAGDLKGTQGVGDVKGTLGNRIYWMAAAAILALFLGTAGYRWYARRATPAIVASQRPEAPPRYQNDLPPGSNGAVLTLAGGQKIVLDSVGNRLLGVQSGTKLTNRNGQIVYEGNTATEPLFNTLTTPKGKQYRLVLSDGSKVWLNAASSIRYPAAFPGNARSVEITGEAYFEIAADRQRPFTVSVNGVKVNVLGTRFNINAYTDEPSVKTTLLDGAVQVAAGGVERTLQPGEQAQTGKDGQTQVSAGVNIEEVVGWKDGYFSFDNTDLATVMREIGRWYDVDIVYRGAVPDRRFGGAISRNSNASQVLKILEESNVYFKIEGREIIVLP